MLGTILGILWFIIKIILWIILGILGLLLTLILMILLVPLRYEVAGSKYEEIQGQAKVSYLFSLIRVYLHYEPKSYWYNVKVLFFTVAKATTIEEEKTDSGDTGADKDTEKRPDTKASFIKEKKANLSTDTKPDLNGLKEAEITSEKSIAPQTVVKRVPDSKMNDSDPDNVKLTTPVSINKLEERKSDQQVKKVVKVTEDPTPEVIVSQEEKTGNTGNTGSPKAINKETVKAREGGKVKSFDIKSKKKSEKTGKKKKDKKKETKKETKKEKPQGLSGMDQVKIMWSFLREERNIGVLRFILKKVFKAIGSVLPKKFKAKIHIGLEDPATTGYIIGSAAAFYHKWGDSLQVTGDFENQVFEGEVDIKGRIIPGIFLWTAIRLYLDGRVRRLIKQVRKLSKEAA